MDSADPSFIDSANPSFGRAAVGSSSVRGHQSLGLLDLLVVTAENLKLLLIIPLLSALAIFGITFVIPKNFTSVAYLGITASEAAAAEALIRSPAVVGTVATNHLEIDSPSDTPEGRMRALNDRVRLILAPGSDKKAAKLYRFEVDQTDPVRAQSINKALIAAWFEATKPKPILKAQLEDQLRRTEEQLKSVSALMARYEKEAPSLISELAKTPVEILQQRALLNKEAVALTTSLAGVTDDVIVSPASLPTEPNSLHRGLLAAAAALSAGALTWIYACAREAALRLGTDAPAAKNLARIRIALRLRRKAL